MWQVMGGSYIWHLHVGITISTTPDRHRMAHFWLLHAHEQAVDDGSPVLFSALPQVVVQHLPPAHADVLRLAQRPADIHLPAAVPQKSVWSVNRWTNLSQPLVQRLHLQGGSQGLWSGSGQEDCSEADAEPWYPQHVTNVHLPAAAAKL